MMTIKGILEKQISIFVFVVYLSLIYMDHLFVLNETSANPANYCRVCKSQFKTVMSKLEGRLSR